MKIFAAIKGFVTTKKVASAIIGVTMIGTASAAGIVAGNHTNVAASIASSATASSSAVASAPSSKVSNTSSVVSAIAPTSSASSTGGTSSTPAGTSSASSGTSARDTELNAENTRHTNALNDINNQYDPKTSALQTEIAGYQSEGVKDETNDMAALQAQTDADSTKLKNTPQDTGATGYVNEYQLAYNQLQNDYGKMYTLKNIQAKYNKMVQDQSRISDLQSQKQSMVDNENALYQQNQINIYKMFA